MRKLVYIVPILLSALTGCHKETIEDSSTLSVPIVESIGGKGTYTYGYIGIGQPSLFSDEDRENKEQREEEEEKESMKEVILTSEDFHMARVGLGLFGMIHEVSLQCVKHHKLKEHTQVYLRTHT